MKRFRIYNKLTVLMVAGFLIVLILNIVSCSSSKKITDKSGAQLWAENCQRCHNLPDPASFSGDQWVTIGMHMQTRALITEQERDKIVEFLQQSAK